MAHTPQVAPGAGNPLPNAFIETMLDNIEEGPAAKATAAGQLFYASGAGVVVPLNAGADGKVLTIVSGVPAWDTGVIPLATDQTKISSTSFSDLTGLSFAVGANENWAFELWLIVTGNAAMDFKLTFTLPSSPTNSNGYWATITPGTGVAIDQYTALTGSFSYDLQGTARQMLPLFRGILINGVNAGTVQAQFAQNTSTAVNLQVHAGSFLRRVRLP